MTPKEIEKEIREELEKGIKRNEILPLDWAMDRIKPILKRGINLTLKEFKDLLIKNSQISFDNKSIVFDREWFYKNVERRKGNEEN